MNIKKNALAKMLIISLLVLAVIIGALHLFSREKGQEGMLLVEYNGRVTGLELAALPTEYVEGAVVNGKGETRTVEGQGIALSSVLEMAGVGEHMRAYIVADDEYRAEISAREIAEKNRVYLMIGDEPYARALVFGDQNSKRNVSGVIRLVVE